MSKLNAALPSLEDLNEIYRIDTASPSGLSRIKATRGRNGRTGPVVSIGTDGYYRMQFDGKFYRTHRIIYFMHTGIDPAQLVVDHIDGNRLNNDVDNLRTCTVQENLWNAKGRPKRSGLPKGIEKLPNGWYRVQVSINAEPHVVELANFRAAENYLKSVRKRHHGEFARA
ncbi:HNH endonuclease [Pseudomonas japonica]|nr:HNH endonuclease [Pseudomonas japonica]